MGDSRNKPGFAFWATVVVVVALVGYPLSFGPACWWFTRHPQRESCLDQIYYPVLRVWDAGPSPVRQALDWYANLGAAFEICVGENNNRQLEIVPTWN